MSTHIVARLGHKGDGLIDTETGVVSLSKVLPGEEIELDDGKLKRVVTPSKDRIPAFCPHYDHCGGCKFQHWREASYSDWKRNTVIAALQHQKLDINVADLIDAQGQGRRRVSLHVRNINSTWRAGFMAAKTHDLVALDHCPVLVPALRHAMHIAAAFGPSLGDCDVAITAADNGLDVAVRAERKAVAKRMANLAEIFHLHGLTRLAVNSEVIAMKAAPILRIGKGDVAIPVLSFLQATQAGEETMATLVCKSLTKSKHVADLFCGVGTFALRIAEKARVTAIDSDKPAITALAQTVRTTQGLKPISPLVRNLFNAPLTAMELNDFDTVVCDPPRSGAEAQMRVLAKSKIKRVISVSCDVQTFARDARILVDAGFRCDGITPIDQFKWSAHVEMVGAFVR